MQILNFRHSNFSQMLIHFHIEYKTVFGEQLMITGSLPDLGNGNRDHSAAMVYSGKGNGIWTFQIETDNRSGFRYRYFLKDHNNNTEKDEWGEDRHFVPTGSEKGIVFLSDHWRTRSDPEYALLTSAFTRVVFRQEELPGQKVNRKKIAKDEIVLRFMPDVARIAPGHHVAVAAGTAKLGNWSEKDALPLGNENFPQWTGDVTVPVSDFPLKYKYLIRNGKNEPIFWESGNNRVVELPTGFVPEVMEIRNELPRLPLPEWKGAGVAIPVFSLRRKNGAGVGEFTDLQLLTDWAVETGIRMIQILPVNDTVAQHTWQDSYPYAAISVFALHPVYINLSEIGPTGFEAVRVLTEQGIHLNKTEQVDYEAVMDIKSKCFKLLYDQMKAEFLADPAFVAFFRNNSHWLKPYAAFSTLRDRFKTPDFSLWNEFSVFSTEMLDELTNPLSPGFDDIAIHYFIQYHAHLQLFRAAEYARSKGVVLKGDLPIGIYRNSVDAWIHPELFNMDCQAGAPPDDFSDNGQNWRFPTYNWEAMERDRFSWWQQRLQHMSVYFDAFRIDHILGFFRIWEIPVSQVQGLMGTFNPSIPYSRSEILSKGIYFDENRFCKPYIRDHFLEDVFGQEKEFVKKNFLKEVAPGCFEMMRGFGTQCEVEANLITPDGAATEEREKLGMIKKGLFTLIAEVIFLEKKESSGTFYYPRNSFQKTYSYRELDGDTRWKLDGIYIDYFYRRNEAYWRRNAMNRLPAVKSATNMLLCGEDLGMVPACVPDVMKELGILSLEVQRMPKDQNTEFGNPDTYPYLSVATPSSHDTSTIRGWWEEERGKTQRYYNEVLGMPGEAPPTCSPDLVSRVVSQHLFSPSMWAVFPLQDLFGMDEALRLPDPHAERINEPGNPNHYWRYRMHCDLEDLPGMVDFNQRLQRMIDSSGRNRIY